MARLSICIPTRDRYAYLKWTLAKLEKDFPDAEIIISDNASSDATQFLWQDRGRTLRNPADIGAFENMRLALYAATGDYAVYCADDDYLLPDQIAQGIAYLEANPTVAAYCAPCEIYNEVEDKPYWPAFKSIDRTFTSGDGVELFNFLISNHVWPEHYIYRVPVAIPQRGRAYWAFADLPFLLEAGGVHFAQAPFYRNLLNHPIGTRVQLGNVQCLTMFDEYRAGLEVLAYKLFGQLPFKSRQRLQEMIGSFICTRYDCAGRIYTNMGMTREAEELAMRIAIADPRRDVTEVTGVAA